MKNTLGRQPTRLGRLIVLEGIDGVGKTTLAALVAESLSQSGEPTITASFPGRTVGTLSAHIYELYHNPRKFGVRMVRPASTQTLVTAAHIDVIETEVIPALRDGKNVVLDRYWWSTLVYGQMAGASSKFLGQLVDLERQIWAHIAPAVLFLVTRRSALKATSERALARGYTRLASDESNRGEYPIVRIRNEATASVAARNVVRHLQTLTRLE